MKGIMKIEVDEDSIAVTTRLNHVSIVDKVRLIEAFGRALEMDERELFAAVKTIPIMRQMYDVETIQIDPAAFGGKAMTDL